MMALVVPAAGPETGTSLGSRAFSVEGEEAGEDFVADGVRPAV